MNKLLLPLLLVISSALCAQTPYPNFQKRASPTTITVDSGATKVYKGLVNGRYADTTAANTEGHIGFYPGALIVTGDTLWMRNSSATKWINQGPSGSLVSTVTIVDSNHIEICNINSCDTITVTNVQGDITNITILSDTTIQVCGSDVAGSEQLTNGTFSGGATGWTLGVLWAYDVNNIVHSFGSTASSFQGGLLSTGVTYTVSVDIGGTTGTVTIALDGGTSQTYSGGAGTSTFVGTWTQSTGLKLNLIPSSDFDGSITNASIKAVLPNCDTLQIPSTNIPIPDTIFVQTPLHAFGTDDDSIYMTQAGPTWSNGDSGWLSTAGYDTFYYKVDSLTHSAANNTDILQFIKNGVTTNWDTLDIVCYGLTNPGDVIWSGTGLVYNVTSANYRIDCKPYISPPTQITLTAADATNPRIDVVYVDSSGNAGLLTGTAAATPVTPQIDPSYQVYLTSILIPAVATIAPIDTAVIYDENSAAPTNWTPITNGGTTTNAANTLNVWRGSLSLDVTNINNGDLINFPRGASIDLSAYQSVVGFIKLKAILPAAANIRILWFNGGSQIGSTVILLLNKSNITTYQAFSVPLTNFAFTQTVVDRFQISYTSNNATVYLGFYADFIYLQNGVAPSPVTGTIVAYNLLTHVKNNNIDSIRAGGTANQNTTFAMGAFNLAISTATAAVNPLAVNSTTGSAVIVTATTGKAIVASSSGGLSTVDVTNSSTGIGVNVVTTSNAAVFGSSTGGVGIDGFSTNSLAGEFVVNPASTNTAIEVFRTARTSSGTTTAGVGGYIGGFLENGAGTLTEASRLTTSLTTVTNGAEVSSFAISLRNAAAIARKALLAGSGKWTWDGYGVGAFTGTVAYGLGVDASGNVIELGSGGGFPTLQQVFNTEVGGSVLTKTDSILTGAFTLKVITATALDNPLSVKATTGTGITVNTTNGHGIVSIATNGDGLQGASTAGTGVTATSTSGAAFAGASGSSVAADLFATPSSTNTITTVANFTRNTSGTAANNIGGSMDMYLQNITGGGNRSNRIEWQWTDAALATYTSQLIFQNANNTTLQDVMKVSGPGQLTLPQYTTSNFNGGVAADSVLVVTSAGVVKKRDAASFAGSTPTWQQTLIAGSQFSQDNTVDLNGKILLFQEAAVNLLTIDPGGFTSSVKATDLTGVCELSLVDDPGHSGVTFRLKTNDGVNNVQIEGDAVANTLTYTADTHTFNVPVGGANSFKVTDGATNFLLIDPTTDAETSVLRSFNVTGGDNESIVSTATEPTISTTTLGSYFNGNTKTAEIRLTSVSAGSGVDISVDGTATGFGPTGVTLGGSVRYSVNSQTTTYSITTSDYFIECPSGTFTATLPTAVSVSGKVYAVKNSGAGVITVATTGGQTIDGAATKVLATMVSVTVISNGANWLII